MRLRPLGFKTGLVSSVRPLRLYRAPARTSLVRRSARVYNLPSPCTPYELARGYIIIVQNVGIDFQWKLMQEDSNESQSLSKALTSPMRQYKKLCVAQTQLEFIMHAKKYPEKSLRYAKQILKLILKMNAVRLNILNELKPHAANSMAHLFTVEDVQGAYHKLFKYSSEDVLTTPLAARIIAQETLAHLHTFSDYWSDDVRACIPEIRNGDRIPPRIRQDFFGCFWAFIDTVAKSTGRLVVHIPNPENQ